MNAAGNLHLSVPSLRGPGLQWLPQVLRRGAYWRTVGRFVLLGPLIGCLPYVWMVISVPVAYFIGAVPALLAGLMYAAWQHGSLGRPPTWPWRAAVGALSGAGGTACFTLGWMAAEKQIPWMAVAVIALHGVPAAVVLALTQKQKPPDQVLGEVSSSTVAPAEAPSSPVCG